MVQALIYKSSGPQEAEGDPAPGEVGADANGLIVAIPSRAAAGEGDGRPLQELVTLGIRMVGGVLHHIEEFTQAGGSKGSQIPGKGDGRPAHEPAGGEHALVGHVIREIHYIFAFLPRIVRKSLMNLHRNQRPHSDESQTRLPAATPEQAQMEAEELQKEYFASIFASCDALEQIAFIQEATALKSGLILLEDCEYLEIRGGVLRRKPPEE